ncbi:T9SS type A sorting domain-containing protein [Flammeovirga pacifica]|uniref:Secretion system C-terminal sorting domain-containing protein n=1 Tax=Flammeovirga pacifica TaxID=915059 RepID=A0A1S1YT36_FLAPC|nr:hypothetical protein NH26_21415 [Flammeovirga pacifica]
MLLENNSTENLSIFSNWRIYPTLVQDTTTVYPPIIGELFKVEIHSVKNNILLYKSTHKGNTEINCKDWPEGIYKIHIRQGNHKFCFRFLIHLL